MIRRSASTFLALLCLLTLAVAVPGPAEAQFGKNKVRYQHFDWRIYKSPHFEVYYYPEEEHLLQKVVSFAESAYDQLSREFKYQIQEPTPLIFYETHSAFEQNNIILNFIPEGIGAFASPVRNRMVMPVDLPDPELMALMLHELTHIFEYHVLFQGNLAKGLASTPPQWFMEGLASYMAKDETARDKMYLRDAVVNDTIPAITQGNVGGFFSYRFGSAVFEYIEEEWENEGLLDFIGEVRNTVGSQVGRAVERSFGESSEDFDADFRRWLRGKYLPELVKTGEPSDFGRRFRTEPGSRGQQISPVASPSGDLVAAFSTIKGDVDLVLFDAKNRVLLSNLTRGFETRFQYLVAQEFTLGRRSGRDIAFSPDGDHLAFFARQDQGRSLVLVDLLKKKVDRVIKMPSVEQQIAPAWSPDGRRVAFSGHRGGQFDIFEIDLQSEAITKVTDDDLFDAAPTYSPDGSSMMLTSVVDGLEKIFRIDLDASRERYPISDGRANDTDPAYSPDGERIYFTSDRSGANNIYSLDLASGKVVQHTNSVTGCFQPTVLQTPEGHDRLVYAAYWKGRFDLYLLDVKDPITEAVVIAETGDADGGGSIAASDIARFEPAIEVSIDDDAVEPYKGRNFFLEDIETFVGISDDQTFVGNTLLTFSDQLGDRRILAAFQSIEQFQNFDVIYANFVHRWQWQAHLFDNRDFFTARNVIDGRVERNRQAFQQTGVSGTLIYPFGTHHRFEIGAGYRHRDIDFLSIVPVLTADLDRQTLIDLAPEDIQEVLSQPGLTDFEIDQILAFTFPGGIAPVPVVSPRTDTYPLLQASLVGDTTIFAPWGPIKGKRWRVSADYAPDFDESGTLTSTLRADYRQYVPFSRRTGMAFRAVGTLSEGNFPSPTFFGGLDTVRGIPFRSLVGDRGFYGNAEFRFPLIDELSTPVIRFGGIRGVVFLDVGGAWLSEFQEFDFFAPGETRLQDAVASYGWGFTVNLFGLNVNADFAKRWDGKDSFGNFESSIWIGTRF